MVESNTTQHIAWDWTALAVRAPLAFPQTKLKNRRNATFDAWSLRL